VDERFGELGKSCGYKSVILKIGAGSFERGFPVTLRIESEGKLIDEIEGCFPPALMIPQQYEEWKSVYGDRGFGDYRKLEAVEAEVTYISLQDSAEALESSLNQWLNSSLNDDFQCIRECLLDNLDKKDDVRFFIQAKDEILQRLPWHIYELFARYQNASVDLFFSAKINSYLPKKLKRQVRILVILGDNADLEVQADLELLKEQLPDAYISEKIAPRRDELNDQLWEQHWDILFFAGHSSSQLGNGAGVFYINQSETLSISDLKHSLHNAIAKGLKLAIFNSCDGLGLAQDLTELHIPAIIVMRERVPDPAAQRFLEYFLKAFAQDKKPLHVAVEEARKRLHGLESLYPCASWLPVLCQHPSAEPLTWIGLREITASNFPQLPSLSRLARVLLTSLLVTGVVVGVRSLGWLQFWEWKAFDHLMQLRPPEGRDSRLLVIEVTEADLQLPEQEDRKGSLADGAIAKLLQNLESYQPRGIGLLIFRDFPVDPQFKKLRDRFESDNRFFAICHAQELGDQDSDESIPRPPELPKKRQGFDNILPDPDGIVRRHLLSMNVSATSRCSAEVSISLLLALRYLELEEKNISPLDFNSEGNLQLGQVIFERLKASMGAYQQVDTGGTQILINYRSPTKIAETVSLADVLADKLNPEIVKDKIILIGARHVNSKYFTTPNGEKISGVMLQAQMISQILSAVLNQRSLIKFWAGWKEGLWIWSWSFFGGVLVVCWRFRWYQGLVEVGLGGILYGVCYYLLIQGYWVPLVPSALAIVATSGLVIVAFQGEQ